MCRISVHPITSVDAGLHIAIISVALSYGLGQPYEKIPSRHGMSVKFADHEFSRRLVEGDHNVATRNDVERAIIPNLIIHQIQQSETDEIF